MLSFVMRELGSMGRYVIRRCCVLMRAFCFGASFLLALFFSEPVFASSSLKFSFSLFPPEIFLMFSLIFVGANNIMCIHVYVCIKEKINNVLKTLFVDLFPSLTLLLRTASK